MQIKYGSTFAQLASLALPLAFIASVTISAQAAAATAPNNAPLISGSPTAVTTAGASYNFQPSASDADGNTLVFSVSSKPVWARLDKATGRFYGIPTNAQAGSYEEIEISVSDGITRSKLPKFAILVNADPALGHAPSISGTPLTTATVNSSYGFQPSAMDMDGDALTFSMTGRPSWATLNKQTGQLTGTPTQVGTYAGVEIAVSDGINVTKLPKFSITVSPPVVTTRSVTVSWQPPTLNTDGTALTNLSGYHIMYGTSPGQYSQTVNLNSVGVTSFLIENLSAGKYYITMTALNSAGTQSDAAKEIAVTL